jgi:hypothetical protein
VEDEARRQAWSAPAAMIILTIYRSYKSIEPTIAAIQTRRNPSAPRLTKMVRPGYLVLQLNLPTD